MSFHILATLSVPIVTVTAHTSSWTQWLKPMLLIVLGFGSRQRSLARLLHLVNQDLEAGLRKLVALGHTQVDIADRELDLAVGRVESI